VLHFFKLAYPQSIGGVEQVIHELASGCAEHGLVIDVLALSNDNTVSHFQINGYSVDLLPADFQIASTSFSYKVIHKFAELARQADVIHYHFPWPFMDMVHFLCGIKKPSVVTYHSDIIRQKFLLNFYKPLMYKFLSNVSHIVATSPNYLLTSLILKKYEDKVSVIPLGINKNKYLHPNSIKLQYWKEKFGYRFFLFVGVLRYYKGLDILLDAAVGTDYPIVILGAGPMEAELRHKAARLGLNNIFFLGFLPEIDKVALLMTCYGIVFPSHLRSEAFGISLLEGAMYGKPLISSEIGTGTSFVNITNETGIVVQPSDSVALRQAMTDLWNDSKMAINMGIKAEERYWKHFTADTMVKSYIDLYFKLIDKSR
jgi:rhamnosyl/mannosyltransferase